MFGFISRQEVKLSAPGEDSNALSASQERKKKKERNVVCRDTTVVVSPVRRHSMSFYFHFNKQKRNPVFSKADD